MSVEKINIYGDEEEEEKISDPNRDYEERPYIAPEPGLEEYKSPKKRKESELPPSMRIVPDRNKSKKPEKPN